MESIVVFVVKYWRDQMVTVGSYVIITWDGEQLSCTRLWEPSPDT